MIRNIAPELIAEFDGDNGREATVSLLHSGDYEILLAKDGKIIGRHAAKSQSVATDIGYLYAKKGTLTNGTK